MSHLSEFRAQTAMTPGPRKEGINTAWDCYTTASKTARAYRSMAKSVNRQISYAVDLIAANEEMDHPETLQLITNTEWSVHRVSPLWNVQYKNKHNKRGATTLANESDFTLGEKPEYDESALKRYAGIIRSFLMKDCSDVQDNPCSVQIKPLKGLRGSRNDKDALKIEVHSVLGDMKRNVFLGILCGIEVSELQISVNDATCLPVLLTNGVVDITDRVKYGLEKCFDCVISPLLFPRYELLYTAALWTGLASAQNTSDFDCSIQPRPSQKNGNKPDGSNKENLLNDTNKDGKGKKLGDEMIFQFRIPEQFPEIRKKISSLKISLSFPEIKDLWNAIHDSKENTVTEQEMEIFHKVIENQIWRALGLKLEALHLESVRLPTISIAEGGRIKIIEDSQVKIVLRNLTAMCHGDMLVANPSLGVADDSMGE